MIEFFFDCSSPWTYLAFHNIQLLAREFRETIRWRPILVGGIFNTINPSVYQSREKPVPAKARYYKKDIADWARLAGLRIKTSSTVFPVNSVKAMWRTAMLVIGAVAWVLLIPAALLVRRPPDAARADGTLPATSAQAPDYPLTAPQALVTPQFVAIALTHFACCAAHSGPIFHMVAYATICGLGPMLAVSVYSVAGLAGLGGRIGLGMAADRIGAKPVLVAGLLVQALAVGAYLFVGALGEFYALSIIFGLAYGGVMPLYAVLVRDQFGPRIMGTTFGAVSMAASLGMALGPWAGGFAFDTYGSYAWLYIGSAAIGLGAVAIALTFRPARLPPAELLALKHA